MVFKKKLSNLASSLLKEPEYGFEIMIMSAFFNINQRDPLSKTSPDKINALERIFYISHEATKKAKKYPSEIELQLVYVLLDRGIHINNSPKSLSPLNGACWFDMDDLIVRLIELGASVNDGKGKFKGRASSFSSGYQWSKN